MSIITIQIGSSRSVHEDIDGHKEVATRISANIASQHHLIDLNSDMVIIRAFLILIAIFGFFNNAVYNLD